MEEKAKNKLVPWNSVERSAELRGFPWIQLTTPLISHSQLSTNDCIHPQSVCRGTYNKQ